MQRCALSALLRDGQIVVVNELALDSHKTKAVAGLIGSLVGESSALVLLPERNDVVEAGIRNLPRAYSLRASYVNVRDLLTYDRVIIPLAALDVIKNLLGKNKE